MMRIRSYRKHKKKCLITGASGFICVNLVFQLADKYEIYGIDVSYGDNIFGTKTEEYIKAANIVYHLAALTNVNKSFKHSEDFFITNVLGTARIVELCVKYKKKLIYPSSAAVYHPELSPYAYTKKLAEDIVRGVGDKIPTVILRLFNVYGQDMNPNSGSIMYNFLKSKNIIVYGDGEQTRDYINVKDVVSIMEDTIKKKWDGKVVEVGMGQATSTNYIAGLFAYYRNKKIEYKPPKREIRWSYADKKALSAIYRKPLISNLDRDIKEMYGNT